MTAFLIDGKNAIFRFGHVHKYLTNSDNEETGALYGISGLLLRAKKHFPDCRFAMVWDGADSHKGWRRKIFPAYKSHRAPVTQEDQEARKKILSQISIVKAFFDVLDIPQLEVPAVEADDLLSILAHELLRHKREPYIYSSDKDFCQLLCRGVQLIRDIDKKTKFRCEDAESVAKSFRCTIPEVLKVRAFLGDPSDGIPRAIRGIGPVGAVRRIRGGYDPSGECLHSDYAEVHRNYQIMQLVEHADDPRLTTEQRQGAKEAVQSCLESFTRPGTIERRRLISFFGRYELEEAIGRRDEYMHIHQQGGNNHEASAIARK